MHPFGYFFLVKTESMFVTATIEKEKLIRNFFF